MSFSLAFVLSGTARIRYREWPLFGAGSARRQSGGSLYNHNCIQTLNGPLDDESAGGPFVQMQSTEKLFMHNYAQKCMHAEYASPDVK